MRHIEWKKLQADPTVLKARQALKMAQEELVADAFWKERALHLIIFPDPDRKKMFCILPTDFSFMLGERHPPGRSEIAWDKIADASQEEAKSLILEGILKFYPNPRASAEIG